MIIVNYMFEYYLFSRIICQNDLWSLIKMISTKILNVIFFFEKFAKLGKKKRSSRPYKPFPFENVLILF